MAYDHRDIRQAYAELGVRSGMVIYVTSDLARLGPFQQPGRQAVLDAHLDALLDLLGPDGTLVVPSASMNLCNTDTVFDPAATPSYMVGALSEYVRTRPGARRSFHPFVSYAAIGAKADWITGDCTRHAYGPMTPEARLIECGALAVSVGRPPNVTCSTVHHVELVMGVPYRYVKEYMHPVRRGDETGAEPFYQYVWYRNSDVQRCQNKRLFARLDGSLEIAKSNLGSSDISAYSMGRFFTLACDIFADDIYIWCDHTPAIRPWQQ